jgi:uncharacterized protein (TIGR04255 family)
LHTSTEYLLYAQEVEMLADVFDERVGVNGLAVFLQRFFEDTCNKNAVQLLYKGRKKRQMRMFEKVRVPKRIASPINEAILEIRYEGLYPGEALYGILFDVFQEKVGNQAVELPIMQIPKQMREADPSLRYQSYYRASNDQFALSVGPRSIVFSALRPYKGWDEWLSFMKPVISEMQKRKLLAKVERIGLRYFDIFEDNIFDKINAGINIDENAVFSSPSSFITEFDEGDTHVILNVSNAVNINNESEFKSLIDIDCICDFNDNAAVFYRDYMTKLDEAHLVNKQVFFGLLKPEFLETLQPEY